MKQIHSHLRFFIIVSDDGSEGEVQIIPSWIGDHSKHDQLNAHERVPTHTLCNSIPRMPWLRVCVDPSLRFFNLRCVHAVGGSENETI